MQYHIVRAYMRCKASRACVSTRYILSSKTYNYHISALASAPSRPPSPTLTPQDQASSKKPSFKIPKTKKTGVLRVNIIPSSHKSAKIAISSCQKSGVSNKI